MAPWARLPPIFLLISSWRHHITLSYPMPKPGKTIRQCYLVLVMFPPLWLLACSDLTCVFLGNRKLAKISLFTHPYPVLFAHLQPCRDLLSSSVTRPTSIESTQCHFPFAWSPPPFSLLGGGEELLWEVLQLLSLPSSVFVLLYINKVGIGRHGLDRKGGSMLILLTCCLSTTPGERCPVLWH